MKLWDKGYSEDERIDRFTVGIVLIAKSESAMQLLNQKIRDREIGKYYYCITLGTFQKKSGMMENYIVKSPGRLFCPQ